MSTEAVEEYLAGLTKLEQDARASRGLPTAHILDFIDFPFRYAAHAFQEFIQNGNTAATQHKGDAFAQMLGVYAAILSGDYALADRCMETYSAHRKAQPLRAMRFTKRYGEPPIEIHDVSGVWPTAPSLFVSCDPAYLEKYGMNLLRSVAANAPGSNVHLHLMGTADAPVISGISLTTTQEIIPKGLPAREYLGAVRLVRFAQAIEKAGVPLIMVDADALVTSDFRHLLKGGNPAMRVRPGRVEPWTQFSACCLRGSPASLGYYKTVADIVLRTMRVPFWGMDQYALFAGYLQDRPKIDLFGPDVASVNADTPGIFWLTAGNAKLSLGTDQSAYAGFFRRYRAG